MHNPGDNKGDRIKRIATIVKTMVSVDFFSVPTIRFQVLYVFLVLAHDRRRIVHFNVTAHPTAEWTTQQLREAFPFEQIPRYLLRDRDRIFGGEFTKDVKAMGIQEVLSAPRSPWQRAYVERVNSSGCTDRGSGASLNKDTPTCRPVEPKPSSKATVISMPRLGGLHHR
jgi:transposase InsO family protein